MKHIPLISSNNRKKSVQKQTILAVATVPHDPCN